MAGRGVAESVFALAEPLAAAAGLVLVDVELVRENGRRILRIVLDKPGGVTVDELEQVHRRLNPLLDDADLIAGSYYVEVASPGLDRPLRKDRDFELFRGREVEVRTFGPVEGRRELVGVLAGLVDGHVVIIGADGQELRVPRDQVARARLHVRF